MSDGAIGARPGPEADPHLAINRLQRQRPVDDDAIDTFLAGVDVPIVEGELCTFLFRGEADEVGVVHRVVGLPDPVPMQRIHATDLWYAVVQLPSGSRVEYQLRVVRAGHEERFNDPLNDAVAHSPMGSSSVCHAVGYEVPDWVHPDPDAEPGTLELRRFASRALGREARVGLYRPAGFRPDGRYPLLIVHDGTDYLQYATAGTVLDNLIHRRDVAPVLAVFVDPEDRITEYADHAGHARFLVGELLPRLQREFPIETTAPGRCLMGSSFGAVAALSTALRHPRTFGSLLFQSGSFVFSDDEGEHGGGPVFDPVVRFVDRYRARPRHVAKRVFMSCGAYEPLVGANREMVPVFERAGMQVRFVESRDGHSWESWRDRLRDGLTFVLPGAGQGGDE